MFGTVRDSLFSTLFPQPCFCCNLKLTTTLAGSACGDCWDATELFGEHSSLCIKCGKPEISSGHPNCRQCRDHEYDAARSVGVYSHALRAVVVGLKTQPQIPRKLVDLLVAAFVRNGFADTSVLVPVPLSKQRRLERGFNQADVIARALSKRVEIRVDQLSLVRTKHSPMHRAGMDEKARDLSVRNSFSVTRPKLVGGRNVLLIDDVLTTGATASYCAQALKKAGAAQVNVLTLARAV